MSGPQDLLENEDRLETRMGAWFPGQRVVFRGKDLFADFGATSWMGLLLYGITGRSFSDTQVRLFEGIWKLCTSYPDPRLWNNRVAALAGTARSTAVLGISAANAVSEATIYGRRPDIRAFDFLLRMQARVEQGAELGEAVITELKEKRALAGYGRPVVRVDERIEPLCRLADELGLGGGKYLLLAREIEKILVHSRWRLSMNVAIVAAALAAEQGLSRREYYYYLTLSFSAGMFPCYIDAADKKEGSFLPLRCERIQYGGKGRRAWDEGEGG